MPIPTVDEVWADFNSNGSVKEPAKQDIRRLLRFIQAIGEANGMEVYPNKAAMDADLTQDDGTPALLYADPVEANNYPTVWIWDDAGNEWIDGVDRISSLKALVDLMHTVMRRVVVLSNEIVIDRLNMLGGGTAQIYIPRAIFIDIPGSAASNLTAANSDSTEKPGWCKLTIPALRSFVYLDRTDNTFKIIGATAGDFTLPTTAADMIVPIITMPTATAGYWSPYRVRDLSPSSNLSLFAALSPIVHSRADNKILIPSATVRSESALFSHTVPATGRYEEFGTTVSNTAAITYWYKFATNTYEVTAGGATPFVVDPTIGMLIGWCTGGEFKSPWPHVGQMGTGLGKNDFAWGKGDRLLEAPHVFSDNPSRLEMVDVDDATLIAAGFTRGIRTTDNALAWPFVGDRLPDARPNKLYFARLWLEATTDGFFGAPRIRFRKADGVNILSVPLVLEKTLSARAAIYSAVLTVPLPGVVGGAGDFTVVDIGTVLTVGQAEVRVVGAQFAFGQGAQWIERDDFPTTPSNAIRISNLEAASAVADPLPAILYGEDLWLITGRKQSLHIDNLYETRTERKEVLTTLIAPKPNVADTEAQPYELTLEAGSFVIDPGEIGDVANIWTHRYSDTAGGAALGRSYRSADITVHKAAASGSGTVRVLGIGDSIMSQTISTYVRDILLARGMAITMSGTIGPTGNEGRSGSTFTDHIRARTTLTPVTNWATYLAAAPSVQITFDPFTRTATGGDPAGSIYNGRIFDFSYYLANTGVTAPTHLWICLGTNDIGTYDPATAADWIDKALAIMVPSILAAVPTIKIGIALPTLPRMGAGDARWNAAYGLALRKILKYKRTLANPLVKVLPIWAHINQVTAFANNEVVVSTDADTGMQTLDNGDMLHPTPAGLHQYAEVVAAWVANTFDGT